MPVGLTLGFAMHLVIIIIIIIIIIIVRLCAWELCIMCIGRRCNYRFRV